MSRNNRSALAKPIDHDHALITSMVRYGESDCVVRMFTKKRGRLNAFFKRGLKGKKGACSIQTLVLANIGLINAHDKLSRLVFCDVDPNTVSISLSLKVFGYRAYICELIEKFLPEEDPAPEIFSIVEDFFHELEKNGARSCLLRAFELKLLDYCGYLPELPSSLDESGIIAFDPISCRFLSNVHDGALSFSIDALRLVKSMLIAKIGGVNYEGAGELLMIGRIFQSRLKLIGLWPLNSVVFLKRLSGH